ncbi:MAG: YbhB/YbcL family Raf kinase inhibitor-like protein [Pirellulales bacterium]|nr:YbhB/YbcL family Raf kinase inhibitor-like protein [Pirellulales bacterium]
MKKSPERIRAWAGVVVALGVVVLTAGCGADARDPSAGSNVASPTADAQGEKPMTIEVTSTAFAEGDRIPVRYTEDGEDISPPIFWSGVPEGTKEFALICDDPDAPTPEPWVHWVIYKIPGNATGLPEHVARTARLKPPETILQGANSWSRPSQPSIGYRGPAPPPGGVHHYRFTVYALDARTVVEPGLTKKQLLEEIKEHVIATGRLTGVYSR